MCGQFFYHHDVMRYNDQFGVAVVFLPTGVLWQQLTYVGKVSVEAEFQTYIIWGGWGVSG